MRTNTNQFYARIIPVILIMGLLLSACASEIQEPEATAASPEILQTEMPVSETSPTQDPTEEVARETESSQTGGITVYQIIPGESKLTYEVGEVFLNQGNAFNLAVGTTSQVEGEITINQANPTESSLGEISADISQFTSDSNRRDNALRDRFIQSSQYPIVTFNAGQIAGLPENYQEGEEISLRISGDLTIREATRPVTFDATVKLEGDTLSGTAETTILMSDFGFGPIDIAGILKTEDEAKVTLNLIARP